LTNWNAVADLISRGASLSGRERDCCFLNTGKPRFADVSAAIGLDLIDDGRGLALVDWDQDGDLDLWYANRTGPRVRMMRNDVDAGNHFLAVRLEGTTCNRDAIGARVELYLKETLSGESLSGGEEAPRLIRTLRAGEGFLSQSSKWVHFGLGKTTAIDRMVVRWPGIGEPEVITRLAADQRYRIVEGSGRAVAVAPRQGQVDLHPSIAQAARSTGHARTVLTQRRPLPTLAYRDFKDRPQTIPSSLGEGPALINLWASWCRPCLVELDELARDESQLRESGLAVVALCTDTLGPQAQKDMSAAKAFVERTGIPFQVGVASEPLVRELNTLYNQIFYHQRPLPLPCSFLVDASGKVAAIYSGPVSPTQLLADVRLVDAPPDELIAAAFPFPGRRVIKNYDPSPLGLAQAYREGEYFDDAKEEVSRYLKNLSSMTDLDSLADDLRQFLPPGVTHERTIPQTTDQGSAGQEAQLANRPNQREGLAVRNGSSRGDSADRARLKRLLEARQRQAKLQALQLLAKIEQDTKDYDQEIEALRQVVQLQPQNVAALTDLALALVRQGNPDEAERHLAQVLETAGEDAKGLVLLGQTRMKLGQISLAIDQFRRAAELAPDSAEIQFNLAMALHLEGKTAEAMEGLRRILGEHPESHDVLNNLAWLYATHPQAEFRNAAEALTLARRLCDATGHAIPAYLDTLAAALAELGEFPSAIEVTEKAIRLARGRGQYELAEKLTARLEAYRANRPIRE
jgi:tetratricopeptide (TPR) repeat protein